MEFAIPCKSPVLYHLGDVGSALLSGNAAQARRYAREWAGLFNNRYYLEVQRAGFADEEHYIHEAVELAAELGLPVVATHPVQFLAADDFKAHEVRVCIAEGYVLNDKRRAKAFTAQQYFKTQAEMAELFADLPEALAEQRRDCAPLQSVADIGQAAPAGFPDAKRREPGRFPARRIGARPAAAHGAAVSRTRHERAAKMPEYQARLEFEIETIIKMGFPGYFLIVADFIRWAKNNGVAGRSRARFRCGLAGGVQPRRSPTSIRCATSCCSSAS